MTAQVAKEKGLLRMQMTYFCSLLILHGKRSMKDMQVDYSDDPRAVRIAAALWWYYVSKLYELLGILV